ncbi:MAG: hypothetical protein JNK04_12980 [Myxococcales bacterium]|nr:hypothetical protein [Myxococcales bacterium]
MSRLFVIAAFVLAACGGEATPSGPTDASTQPAGTSAKPAVTSASVVASGTPSASAIPAKAGLEPSQANVGKLLEGGEALKSLPSRPVDSGKGFDPELRSKLAPQAPAGR